MKKLNFGCGRDKLEGYMNVDILREVKPDLVVPPLPQKQPFEDKEFDEIFVHAVTPYLRISEVIPSLKELCRIGKKVIINFVPVTGRPTIIFENDISSTGYSIGDLRNLDYRMKKDNDWIKRDYNLKVNKIWFSLHFERYFPFNVVKWFINKNPKRQSIYQKSFLMYFFPPQFIWMELEDVKK